MNLCLGIRRNMLHLFLNVDIYWINNQFNDMLFKLYTVYNRLVEVEYPALESLYKMY